MDGFDYYVSDEHAVANDFALYGGHITKKIVDTEWTTGDKKIIATTNPSIDLPKVVDEVEKYSEEFVSDIVNPMVKKGFKLCFTEGYNKSQETHPFSEDDMIDFAEWSQICQWNFNGSTKIWWSILYTNSFPTTQELLQLWKEQQPKIVYYND